ncbi:hypothetical protein Tco_0157017 [Tanacetum coccineum]
MARRGCRELRWGRMSPRLVLRGYSGLQIVLHLNRRLSGVLWKVGEGLGSHWNIMEALRNPRSFLPWKAMANETEKNGASGSTVVDENRGQDDARQYPKKRGMSKDVVGSLDKRVAGVETSMAELKTQVEGLKSLDSDFTSMREDF